MLLFQQKHCKAVKYSKSVTGVFEDSQLLRLPAISSKMHSLVKKTKQKQNKNNTKQQQKQKKTFFFLKSRSFRLCFQ